MKSFFYDDLKKRATWSFLILSFGSAWILKDLMLKINLIYTDETLNANIMAIKKYMKFTIITVILGKGQQQKVYEYHNILGAK